MLFNLVVCILVISSTKAVVDWFSKVVKEPKVAIYLVLLTKEEIKRISKGRKAYIKSRGEPVLRWC